MVSDPILTIANLMQNQTTQVAPSRQEEPAMTKWLEITCENCDVKFRVSSVDMGEETEASCPHCRHRNDLPEGWTRLRIFDESDVENQDDDEK